MDTTFKIPKNVKVTRDIEEHNFLRNHEANYTCDYCSFKGIEHKDLTRHVDKVHKKSYHTYSCYQCDYEFRYRNDLIKHIETKHRRKEFRCYQCKYKSTEKFKLLRHIKYSHEKKYSYDKSKYLIHEKDNLNSNNNSNYNLSLYGCNKCDHIADTHKSLNIHKQASHGDIKYQKSNNNMRKRSDSSQNYSKYKYSSIICDQCDYKTSKQSQLIYHKKTEHEGNNFKKYKILWKSNHTNANNSTNTDKTYRCDQCDYYQTSNQGKFIIHVGAIHQGIIYKQSYSCEMCNYNTSKKSKLTTHKARKHVRYTCNVSEYSTCENIKLTIYKEKEVNREKTREWSKNLEESNPFNNQQSTYRCNKSEYLSDKENMLTTHEQSEHLTRILDNDLINNKEPIYSCNECEYITDLASMITSHKQSKHMTFIKKNIQINNNQSTFTCDQCEYVTDKENMLTTHEQSKHMEIIEKRNYMCFFCDYETDQKDIFNVHVQNCD